MGIYWKSGQIYSRKKPFSIIKEDKEEGIEIIKTR